MTPNNVQQFDLSKVAERIAAGTLEFVRVGHSYSYSSTTYDSHTGKPVEAIGTLTREAVEDQKQQLAGIQASLEAVTGAMDAADVAYAARTANKK